ncbi:ALBINO3-LIKE PROTEIN 3 MITOCHONDRIAL [Salix koriyanagi]|uniref:ALBINO3-LIKE PROTEIN 3 MITOCHONDRIAL n=1 Tax=Salix koriyanagi TaxID=2511006 RepID=A0A9Q0TS65_9ROSI|nr:ALBINO3-LIKE PROTEIN 3 MITOCHONDRIAL [Salix koriyanagi]
MATRSLLLSTLRRSRPLSTLSRLLTNSSPSPSSLNSRPSNAISSPNSLASFNFPSCRTLSTRTESESINLEELAGPVSTETEDGVVNSIIPVDSMIWLLDSYHDLTGLPWWIIVASSTLAMRLTLFPLYVLQMHKIKEISQSFSKLPPLFPPPLSGRSYIEQISLLRKERRAIGCPSFLWFPAFLSVQIPCFLVWMTSIRRMCLDNHPGFDCGGTLWFQNLTKLPHGFLGPIFPFLIAGLHGVNVHLSFGRSSAQNTSGLLGLLSEYYQKYLNFMMLPLFFIGYCIPQGSLVYWVTNSSLTAIQQVSLKLPVKWLHMKLRKVSPENLTPHELLVLSVKLLSSGHRARAIPLLQMALEKDPGYIRALIVMGQARLQEGLCAEATDHLERAISNLILTGHPTAEDVDHLILASQWAGVAYIRQGKNAEGITHLERITSLEEPEDPQSKAHYFDGLLLLASALSKEGRNAEAVKYLRLVVAYDPSRKEFLDQCL